MFLHLRDAREQRQTQRLPIVGRQVQRMGRLTTHVLDTALGRPGAGIAVALYRLTAAGGREKLGDFITNADGRCERPLLEGEEFKVGTYELVFAAGAYFDRVGLSLSDPKFLDEVTI